MKFKALVYFILRNVGVVNLQVVHLLYEVEQLDAPSL